MPCRNGALLAFCAWRPSAPGACGDCLRNSYRCDSMALGPRPTQTLSPRVRFHAARCIQHQRYKVTPAAVPYNRKNWVPSPPRRQVWEAAVAAHKRPAQASRPVPARGPPLVPAPPAAPRRATTRTRTKTRRSMMATAAMKMKTRTTMATSRTRTQLQSRASRCAGGLLHVWRMCFSNAWELLPAADEAIKFQQPDC